MLTAKNHGSTTLAMIVAAMLAFLPSRSWSNASDADVKSLKVSTAGVDLNSETGAKALYIRLREASRSVCGLEFSGDPIYGANFDSCYKATLSNAVHSVNRPLVTKLLNEKYAPSDLATDGKPRLASK